MEWREEGVLLTSRPHGENAAIIEVFTEGRGRHAGVVRGGTGRRMAPILQPGAQLDLSWRARLEDHLGAFTVEPIRARAAGVLGDRRALAGLGSVTALLSFVLPERAAYPRLYARSLTVLDLIEEGSEHWPLAYLRWELALLDEMGFGLDLTCCAATGATEGLVYVSPKTGRAVSAEGAGEWAPKLLPLPPCLMGEPPESPGELAQGFETTGYFLDHQLRTSLGEKPLPAARGRLVRVLAKP
ncbi:DNA repair protein RecO [Vannielia litorea]|uniref:DNA repair protein RecO n=1 Tax=Vannielia litorea TaxID=1217970 RepID=UPI001C98C40C|nr:DNA repair protein RecO [Vannielia litorea]MBY6048627.1 DNA repair protein RecO [Vannielia litorea]MBY6076041.1 DNA repair protein RecO [Vannielia litorea]